MKLNIIIPIYNPETDIKEILSNFTDQKSQEFNINLIIDKPSSLYLEQINEARKIFGDDRLNITINTKHQSLNKVIYESLHNTKATYTYIFFTSADIDNKWVQDVVATLKRHKPDVLETRAIYRGLVKFDADKKDLENKVYDLQTQNFAISYTEPVLFNKVFKTSILKNVYKNFKSLKSNNKQYSIDICYSALLEAKTYYYSNDIETRDWNYQLSHLNIKTLNSEWRAIKSHFEENTTDGLDLFTFAKFFNFQIFVAGYLGYIKKWKMRILGRTIKTKNIKEVLVKELTSFYEENKDLKSNKYLLLHKFKNLADPKYIDENTWSDIFHKYI